MITNASRRKPWNAPRLTRIVPDAQLVRQVLAANGIQDVPPGLAHLIAPVPANGER